MRKSLVSVLCLFVVLFVFMLGVIPVNADSGAKNLENSIKINTGEVSYINGVKMARAYNTHTNKSYLVSLDRNLRTSSFIVGDLDRLFELLGGKFKAERKMIQYTYKSLEEKVDDYYSYGAESHTVERDTVYITQNGEHVLSYFNLSYMDKFSNEHSLCLNSTDTPPVLEYGVYFVPLRLTFESLGYTVVYDPADATITIGE